jgi:hypothetical protein
VGIAGNLPFALVPVAVMAVYLACAKRLGAFEALGGERDMEGRARESARA